MSIGQRIKERRKSLNLTQGDVAESLNVTKAAVSGWERDEFDILALNFLNLSRVLEIDPFELMGEEASTVGPQISVERLSEVVEILKLIPDSESNLIKAKVLAYAYENPEFSLTKNSIKGLVKLARS